MRKLKLKINDKDFDLSLNRAAIRWLEANGFVIEEFDKKPVTYYDLLWYSLFIENHPEVNPSLSIKLMDSYKKSGKSVGNVIRFAIEEYTAFMNALSDTDLTANDLEIMEI